MARTATDIPSDIIITMIVCGTVLLLAGTVIGQWLITLAVGLMIGSAAK